MKNLSTVLLDKNIYMDRARTIVGTDATGGPFTLRNYLLFLLDLPSPNPAVKFSRELSKKIDRVWCAVKNDDFLENSDFDYLKEVTESGIINNKTVFDIVAQLLDQAVDVLPSALEKTTEK